jgi:hypothetical protein
MEKQAASRPADGRAVARELLAMASAWDAPAPPVPGARQGRAAAGAGIVPGHNP